MSRYDGLNLPQLLELMHELVIPDAVAWLPGTTGWWIVLAWLAAIFVLLGMQLIRRRRRNRYRRDALAELSTILAATELGPQESAQHIAALLKRTALVAYPRKDVAALYGDAWADFLRESTRNDRQIAASAEMLASAAYRPDVDGSLLSQAARRWIRLHRA